MRKGLFTIPALALCTILLSVNPTNAQQLFLSADGGISKVVGPQFEDWNWGFSLGAHGMFFFSPNFLLGARVAYNRWTPDDEDLTADIADLVNVEVEGAGWVMEIVPTLRLTTNYPLSAINFFAQAGAGLYIIKTQTEVTGTVLGNPFDESFGEDTDSRFGLSFGAGVTLGSPDYVSISVFPSYNIVFLDDDKWQYFTINVGLGVGI